MNTLNNYSGIPIDSFNDDTIAFLFVKISLDHI